MPTIISPVSFEWGSSCTLFCRPLCAPYPLKGFLSCTQSTHAGARRRGIAHARGIFPLLCQPSITLHPFLHLIYLCRRQEARRRSRPRRAARQQRQQRRSRLTTRVPRWLLRRPLSARPSPAERHSPESESIVGPYEKLVGMAGTGWHGRAWTAQLSTSFTAWRQHGSHGPCHGMACHVKVSSGCSWQRRCRLRTVDEATCKLHRSRCLLSLTSSPGPS